MAEAPRIGTKDRDQLVAAAMHFCCKYPQGMRLEPSTSDLRSTMSKPSESEVNRNACARPRSAIQL
eukprot:3112264-Amphidinium_carterae.2